jgi:hypothetical protein
MADKGMSMLYSGINPSEEPSANTFNVEKWHFYILKMNAVGSSKMLVLMY